MHLEMALNFCMEHDQHTLSNGEGQEITELAGWGYLGKNLIPPKGSSRHFSETKVCYLALFLCSLELASIARGWEGCEIHWYS